MIMSCYLITVINLFVLAFCAVLFFFLNYLTSKSSHIQLFFVGYELRYHDLFKKDFPQYSEWVHLMYNWERNCCIDHNQE